jgi:hypothetical protein
VDAHQLRRVIDGEHSHRPGGAGYTTWEGMSSQKESLHHLEWVASE